MRRRVDASEMSGTLEEYPKVKKTPKSNTEGWLAGVNVGILLVLFNERIGWNGWLGGIRPAISCVVFDCSSSFVERFSLAPRYFGAFLLADLHLVKYRFLDNEQMCIYTFPQRAGSPCQPRYITSLEKVSRSHPTFPSRKNCVLRATELQDILS